jgi:hypothetical protein
MHASHPELVQRFPAAADDPVAGFFGSFSMFVFLYPTNSGEVSSLTRRKLAGGLGVSLPMVRGEAGGL